MDIPSLHMRGYPENPNVPFSKSPCNVASVAHALATGCDPNVQWEELDLVAPKSTGGCVINISAPPGYNSWANWNTPLHKAMMGRHYDAVELLLEGGAEIELRNALGRTVLHEAVHEQDREGVRFLIGAGANLDTETEARRLTDQFYEREGVAGLIPLRQAMVNGDSQTFRLLVDAGASTKHCCPGGWSLLDFALIERQVAMMEMLLASGATFSHDVPSGMDPSLQSSNQDQIRLLLANDNTFPPFRCREAYVHVITQPAFREISTDLSLDPAQRSERLLSTFSSLASGIAQVPDPEVIPGPPYCSYCTDFQRQVRPDHWGPFQHHPTHSSLKTSANRGCSLCAILEDGLENGTGRWTGYHCRKVYDHMGATHVAIVMDFDSRGVRVSCEDKDAVLQLEYLHDAFVFDRKVHSDDFTLGTGSSLAFLLARSWLDSCRSDHKHCIKSGVQSPVLPNRVIDVGYESQAPRLHCSEGDRSPYAALSYCWGITRSLVLTRETLSQWTEAIPLSALAPTFRDAIVATRKLGLRYVWIDALCIIQDAEDEWSHEASQMHKTFANATITLSAHDSKDVSEGLFRPRGKHSTHPVQLAIRVPQKYRSGRYHRQNHNCMFVLPVQAEKALWEPGPVQQRGWTLQQHALSTRILHFGAGLLYWECLEIHASEWDLQGDSHPYCSSVTNFMDAREHKRNLLIQREQDALKNEDEAIEETIDETDSDDQTVLTPSEHSDTSAELAEAGEGSEGRNSQDPQRTRTNKIAFPNLKVYTEWQRLVSEYSSRTLTKQLDKITAMLGLSKLLEPTLRDESMAGVWKGTHLLPSLLWYAEKPGGASRIPKFPSWSWASVQGEVKYSPLPESLELDWQPSDMTFEADAVDASQSLVTGSVSFSTVIRRFPADFKFWDYRNFFGNPLQTHLNFGEIDNMSEERLLEELAVIEGYKDICVSTDGSEAQKDPKEGEDLYCAVIVRVPRVPPPKFGYPTFPGGRPPSIHCLCLKPVHRNGSDVTDGGRVFRRVGECEFWDVDTLWEKASRERVTIV